MVKTFKSNVQGKLFDNIHVQDIHSLVFKAKSTLIFTLVTLPKTEAFCPRENLKKKGKLKHLCTFLQQYRTDHIICGSQ